MTIFLLLLLFSPSLIYAGCGDCDAVDKELEKERESDEKFHACRSCRAPIIASGACPEFGYECDNERWGITTNVLSAPDSCQCLEAKCVGKTGKLWLMTESGTEPELVNRMYCNSSAWMVDGEEVAAVVCAKDCDKGACLAASPGYSTDFKPLTVIPANANDKCAFGLCSPDFGMATLNADGSLLKVLDPSINKVTCTGDGEWTYGAGEGKEEQKYVMCIASLCGPTKCPAAVTYNSPDQVLIPLTVTGNGDQCATATCSAGFVEIKDGAIFGPIATTQLTCRHDGKWVSIAGEFAAVMCKQPPCPSTCDPKPLEFHATFGNSMMFTAPIRTGCDYACPDNQGLFYYDTILQVPVSITGASCKSNGYSINSTLTVDQIGCYDCDNLDGEHEGTQGDTKAFFENCVLSCPHNYQLRHYGSTNEKMDVQHLYRYFTNMVTQKMWWYDAERGMVMETREVECVPK